MVVHLSSKLSHLAQSFRPQHHFQTLRSAFPSSHHSGASTGFFDSAHHISQQQAHPNGLGVAVPNPQPAGANGGSSAGGAGGAKRSAGSRSQPWNFQYRLVPQAPVAADHPSSRLNDEDDSDMTLRRPSLFTSNRSHSSSRLPLRTRSRSSSLVGSDRAELLTLEESGLSGSNSARLSSAEMQRRYRSAFASGQMTEEVKEMSLEADEMDFGSPAMVRSSRRASISSPSTSATPKLRPATPAVTRPSTPSTSRSLHTSARAASFVRSSPPLASVPRVRRNSTSSATPTPAVSDSPLADIDPLNFPRKTHRPREKRPPNSAKADVKPTPYRHKLSQGPVGASPEAQARHAAINAARQAKDYVTLERAVLNYLAVPKDYSVSTHNAAMEALRTTRLPNTPIRPIVELYTQLFNHETLRPDKESYEIIIRTLSTRDSEVLRNIKFIEKREKKKKLAAAARGPFDQIVPGQKMVTPTEEKELALLKKEDYLTPAVEIYKALGPMGDKISHLAVANLISAAAGRKRVDLALSLFGRLEKSPHQVVTSYVYEVLIKMYGEDGDAASVMEVFEAYLDARSKGLRPSSPVRTDMPRTLSTKHHHAALPDYEHVTSTGYYSGGDEAIWKTTISSLLAAGDAAQAVTVFQRMLDAIPTGDKPQNAVGYPTVLRPDAISAIVAGFVKMGDLDSAITWFDRGLQPNSGADTTATPHLAYFTLPYYSAVDDLTKTLIVNHIYRALLARASSTFPLIIGDFIAAIDHNLAVIYTASTPEKRDEAVRTVIEFRQAFEKANKAGFVDGDDYTHSTGLLSRIGVALGYSGHFKEAAETFVVFTKHVRRAVEHAERTNHEDLRRTAERWLIIASGDVAAGALGMRNTGKKSSNPRGYSFPSDSRPPIKPVAQIVSALNSLRAMREWDNVYAFEAAVVESYVQSKAEAKGDVASLKLSGDLWYTIIEAQASMSAQVRRGYVPSSEFPGFEPIIDDFAASGTSIPQNSANYTLLVKNLKDGGMSRDRILAVLAVLDQNLAYSVQAEGQPAATAVLDAADKPTQVEPTLEELGPSAATSEQDSSSAPDSNQATSATSFPTPPSTPPTYFSELPSAPPAPPAVQSVDVQLTVSIDALLFNAQTNKAMKLVRETASQGHFAHPEALGRLIDSLGREGKVDAVREVYLLAYSSLGAMGSDPSAQSLAWIQLEDHMIIALAQAGLLEDVGYHRDRLLEAGVAPSADAYAAMILNMKETTDDAAVALMLFEESQRFNVAPNVYLFNTLISKLSRARRAKEALEYFELMKRYNLTPSSITYGAVINACCKTGDDGSAAYLFQEMVASPKFKPRVPPYNTMIQFYTSTKPDRERALHYYEQLRAAQVAPTGHTYKLLLDAYGSIGEPDLVAMQRVFDKLAKDHRVSVTGAHWASLINAHGVVAKDLATAIKVFESVERHPSSQKSSVKLPDAVVYESLLNALLANDRADLCSKYLEQMEQKGVRMTAYVANTLIKGHASQKNMEAARGVFERMQDPPSGVAAAGNHPVDRHPKHQHHASSSSGTATGPVFREPSTWETMIRCELAAGENERAVQLMKRVDARAFPDAVTGRIRKMLSDVGLETLPMPSQTGAPSA